MTELQDAWEAIRAAKPPGWYVGRPGQRLGGTWAQYAYDQTERAVAAPGRVTNYDPAAASPRHGRQINGEFEMTKFRLAAIVLGVGLLVAVMARDPMPASGAAGHTYFRSGVITVNGSGETAKLSVLNLSGNQAQAVRLRFIDEAGVVRSERTIAPVDSGEVSQVLTFNPASTLRLRAEIYITVPGEQQPEWWPATYEIVAGGHSKVVLEHFAKQTTL
jgi:hypothetical protein